MKEIIQKIKNYDIMNMRCVYGRMHMNKNNYHNTIDKQRIGLYYIIIQNIYELYYIK